MAKNDKVLEVVKNEMIKRIEEAIENNSSAPWQKPWKGQCNYVSGHQYRGINTFILPTDETHFITYNQIKQLKAMNKYSNIEVKEDAVYFPVIFWKWYKKKVEEENIETGKMETEYVKYPRVFFYRVYRASDVLNLPEKNIDTEFRNVEDADDFMSKIDADISVVKGSNRAFYSPIKDFVQVPSKEQFENSNEFYSTLFHELGHWTGHSSRCNRNIQNNFGDNEYSKEELCAEMTASLMLGYFNIDDERVKGNQVAYLKGWLENIRKSEVNFITWAGQMAQKASEYLLINSGYEVEKEVDKAS